MANTNINPKSKICCERYKKHLHAYPVTCNSKCCASNNCVTSIEGTSYRESVSQSAGKLISNNKLDKPKKTTKSELVICKNVTPNYKMIDCCQKCGDTSVKNTKNSAKNITNRGLTSVKTSNNGTRTSKNGKKSLLKQHYKNENFQQSTDSIGGKDKHNGNYLNTIKEQTEKVSTSNSYLEIVSDSDHETGFMYPNDSGNISSIKKFRRDNYFECHSAKSRVGSNNSVTSLKNHKCIYRFYLNDRLFPVPLNTDCNNTIRCVDCHLPLPSKDIDSETCKINGTVQAKVRLNNDVQDMMLILPVKKHFLVNERRNQQKKEEDSLYFGIVKLSLNGDSMFNRNVPSNSFALKYQKGYKELNIANEEYQYESVANNDIIFV